MKKNLILKLNKSTVRRAVLAAMCCVCALSIAACGKKDNRNENREQNNQPAKMKAGILRDFYIKGDRCDHI